MRGRKVTLKVFLVLVAVVVLGEVVLQLMGLGHPILVTTNSPANYEFVPNQHLHRTWPMSDSLISWVSTNQYGMRSPRIEPEPPANTLRVYFLGDSIPYGTTQVSQSQIFVSRIARKLPGIVHRPVQALNGSCGGWAIPNELLYLKEHGLLGASRVILVLNDGDPMQPISAKPTKTVNAGIPTLKNHPIFGYQELWDRGLEPMLRGKLYEWHLLSSEGPRMTDPGDAVTEDMDALKINLQDLTLMQQYVQKSGAHMSIVFVSFSQDLEGGEGASLADYGRHAIHGWAQKHNVPFLNLAQVLAKYPADSIRLRDHAHFNVKGNKIAAAAILKNWSLLDPGTVSASGAANGKSSGKH